MNHRNGVGTAALFAASLVGLVAAAGPVRAEYRFESGPFLSADRPWTRSDRVVGTIELDNEVYGLISDTEGTIHRVREGNYMGQNHGRILQVNQAGIQLVELVTDGADGWMERDASIALGDDSAL